MLDLIWWLLTVEAIGLAAFPVAYFLLPRLFDRGFSVSKPLGILAIGYASWILSVLHILPSVRLSIIALLLVLGGLSGWYAWGRRQEFKDFVMRERTALIAAEVIFLFFFVGWAVFRAYDPAIDHTEQPMDFAFLNASIQSSVGPPEDPWLRGESVSYYYFGYWMMGATSQISGVPSNISYNLSMALIPAMAAMGIFGLVSTMVRTEGRRWPYAILGGVAGGVLLGVVANLEGVLEFMRAGGMGSQEFWDWIRIEGLNGPFPTPSESWHPDEFWWWFRSTRVINTFDGAQGIDYTIQEFPFFSFMLGDLHPHVMSVPFAIMFIVLCWNFLKSPMHVWREGSIYGYASIAIIALALGGLAFTNMWDLPTFAALFLGMAALKTYSARGGDVWALFRDIVPIVLAVIGLAVLLFLPYYLTFTSSVTGVEVVKTTTRPIHTFLIWGLHLVIIAPFIVSTFWQTTVPVDWRRLTVISLLVGFLPYMVWVVIPGEADDGLRARFFHVLPLALLISMAVYSALSLVKRDGPTGRVFAMALSALGLLLIMGSELLFIGDFFNSRMNTIFKLYYQAWILLAVASGFAIYYWRSLRESLWGWKRSLTTLWAGAFVVLLVGSLYYPLAATVSKGGPFIGDATLDGLAFVAQSRPAEYEAIEFVRRNVGQDAGILEAVGEWSDAGLISRSTGVSTVFNWPGHEVQWRGSSELFDGREGDVARIYQTQDAEEARNLLAKYDIEYIYVGPRERQQYNVVALEKFESFADTVFGPRDDVVIYRVRE